MDKEGEKEIVKEAIKEWLDDKVRQFGWFSLKILLYAAVAAVAYFSLMVHGWKPPA